MREHVNRKKLGGAGAVAIGAATAVTALLVGSAVAAADEAHPSSSAYGISASGLLTINPTPYVESTDGERAHDQLLKLEPSKDLALGVLTVDAGDGAATTSVAKVNLLGLIRADLVTTSCKDGRGALEIINGSILGQRIPEHPISGQSIDLSPLLSVTLGDETRNADDSITVTGIEVKVLPGNTDRNEKLTGSQKAALPALGNLLGRPMPASPTSAGDVFDALSGLTGGGKTLQTVTIGSATCGAGQDGPGGEEPPTGGEPPTDEPASDGPASDGPASDEHGSGEHGSGDQPGTDEAPAPEVVQANLPVTG
jgi:hypothetical protein